MTSPLHSRNYRRLFAAQVIALVGTGLSTVALALLAFELAGDKAGAVLGTALTIKMVTYVGIAPVVGSLMHRLPRKGLLITLDLARAGIVLSLPFVSEVWHVYALIFLLNACSAGFTPTFQATVPDILPDEAQYTRALSLSRLAYDLENLLSPTLAAAALAFVSFDVLFAANGAAFAASALLVLSVTLPRPKVGERGNGTLENLTYGVRSYLATPRLKGLLALSLAVAAAGAMVIVNSVVYVRAELGLSASVTAIVLAAFGGGSMVVALLLPKLLEQLPERAVMLAGGGGLAAALALGLTRPPLPGLVVLWFVLGAGASLIQTPTGRLLLRSCRESDRPAYYAAQFALSHAAWLAAYPLAGWLGAVFGLPIAFAVLAGVAACATLVAAQAWPAADPFELDHVHAAIEHDHMHTHDAHHQHEHEGREGPEPHRHHHRHPLMQHRHALVIDLHHRRWPG